MAMRACSSSNMRVSRMRSSTCRLTTCVALGTFLMQLILHPLLNFTAAKVSGTKDVGSGWSHPVVSRSDQRRSPSFLVSASSRAHARPRLVRTAVELDILIKAFSAGALASFIKGMFEVMGEPNMKFMGRAKANLLLLPVFEVINAACACLSLQPWLRGLVAGIVFTSVTLPATNYRYRKSMGLSVTLGGLLDAGLPTLLRDMTYGIGRNYLTLTVIGSFPRWNMYSPELLLVTVIGGSLASAPFSEWRNLLLQKKGTTVPLLENFKFGAFISSSLLEAIKQGLALSIGYYSVRGVVAFIGGV